MAVVDALARSCKSAMRSGASSFEKRVDGTLTPFGTPQAFSVEALGLQTLKAADAAELLAFQRKTARLQRAVMGATEAADQLRQRLQMGQ